MSRPTMIVITGPTASGKSVLAVDVARRLGTEIISADSRQVFKGIPIVTAVPPSEERGGVPHHLLEMLPLDAYYSASMFEQDALRLGSDIMSRCGSAIVCGGSMMYIDALCDGIDDLPTVSEDLRNSLTHEHKQKGDAWLLEQLRLYDPAAWRRIDRKNIKRVFHALEISLQAGQPYTSLLGKRKKQRPFKILKFFINHDRTVLFDRINRRVDMMIDSGLEEEIRSIEHLRGLNSLNTVGVKEILAYFDGKMTRDTAIERIKKNTRVYAKKQMTWFARDKEIVRLNPANAMEDILSRL